MTEKCRYAKFRLGDAPTEGIPFSARSVGHHTVPAGWADEVFRVHHVAIYWGIRGRGGIEIGAGKYRLEPERIGIYFPGAEQVLYALDEPWEYCWWTMDGPMAEQVVSSFGFTGGIYRVGPAPLNYINALESMIQGPGRQNEISASALAYQLLCVAAQHHGTDSQSRRHATLIEKATEIILASWPDPAFSVESLASELDIHRSTLARRFRQSRGTTLTDYITAMRLQNAVAMLRETPLSVAEIAGQCGYADPNYFSKQMKIKLGMPPSEFRRRAET